VEQARVLELNVTRWPPGIVAPFTSALSRSAILPGDGNYRDNLNAGIIAMTMDGIVVSGHSHTRGNQR